MTDRETLLIAAAAISSFMVSAAATPVFGWLASRSGLMKTSRSDRWTIRRPIPLLGGGALALASLVAFALFGSGSSVPVILVCGVLAFCLGLLDDIRGLAPTTKLVGQVMIASLLAYGGVRAEIVPFAPIAFLITILWVVGMMNALNLMDNMDGLAAGIAAIAAIALALTGVAKVPSAGILGVVTAGAALGFLLYNFAPAKIFMGDAGSQLLGFLLAAAALLHTSTAATNVGLALIGPLAVLALPIFDTTLVSISRVVAGRSIGQGGRDHTSHRLAALGLSDRSSVLFLYSVGAGLAALGILAERLSSSVLPLVVLGGIGLVLFGVFLHEVDVYGRRGLRTAAAAVPSSRSQSMRQGIVLYGRFGAEVALDAVLLTVAYYTSFLLRFEGPPEASWLYLFVQSVPLVVATQLGGLVLLSVYRTLWRYLSLSDALRIAEGILLGTAGAVIALVLLYRFEGYSRAAIIMDGVLASALLMGSRSFVLWLREAFAVRGRRAASKVLIVGATDRGAFALRLLASSTDAQHEVVGFVDDDPGKRYRRVAGVPIVGSVGDLEVSIGRYDIDLVVVATEDPEHAAQAREICDRVGVSCREFLVTV